MSGDEQVPGQEPVADGPRPVRAAAATASTATRIVLVLAVLAVAAGLYVDSDRTDDVDPVTPTGVGAPTAGTTTCAALSLEESGDDGGEPGGDVAVAAVASAAAASSEDGSARFTLADGDAREGLGVLSDANPIASAEVTPSETALVTARWEGLPTLVGRRLTPPDGARVAGRVEGLCPAGSADRWWVPGLVTAGGASATLHLGNPTGASASVSIALTTAEDRIEPTRLGNVVVPAGERRVVDLNEFVPERPDLGVDVVARSGQVTVEAVQQLEAAIDGIDGRSLVTGHSTPAEEWTVPWVDGEEGSAAWLWVTNPGDRATEVRIAVHGEDGPTVPPGAGSGIGPGRTQRIDLRGSLDAGSRAVTVRASEGVPVVVSGVVVRSGVPVAVSAEAAADEPAPSDDQPEDEDPLAALEDDGAGSERGGIAVVGAVEPSSGPLGTVLEPAAGPQTLLLTNPGEDAATVVASVLDVAGTMPLAELTIEPGATSSVPVTGRDDGAVRAVIVEATTGRVAAAVVGATTTGPLELTAVGLRPFVSESVVVIDEVRRDRSLLHPIDLGPPTQPVVDGEELPSVPVGGSPTPTVGDG